MSKASRRSSRTTRGAAGRPAGAGLSRAGSPGTPAGTPPSSASGTSAAAGPASGPAAIPTVDASALVQRAPAGRPASTRSAGTRSGSGRATGSTRRRQLYQPSFLERHRTALLGAGALVVVALLGAFFFVNATAAAYSCGTITPQLPAGTPLPNGSPAPLGQPQPDMGNLHITIGSDQHYAYCPPASGPHYNNAGIDGPIPAKYYGPDDGARPEGWIHNMEHGAVVILYNCKLGACDDATLAALQAIPVGFPNSPVCGVRAGVLAPVIARFDDMPTKFAALVWDRLLYLNTLDVAQIKTFYATQGELFNPEPQCARPSPSAGPSVAPSGSSAAPSAAPGSSIVTPSAAPSAAPSVAPSGSAAPS